MALRVFNTLTRGKAPLTPLTQGRVKLYVCGPTVYDEPHLGHARSAVVFDVIRRYLACRGFQVTLVRNITDIDDKIIARACRDKLDYRRCAARYTHHYQRAMTRLNVQPPDAEPRVTDYILPIQEMIARLLQSGHAYRVNGSVYFGVPTFKPYGRLSGRSIADHPAVEKTAGETGKRHPADFALWKAAKPDEPRWPSPWGAGRPGWHIECSAMSAKLLGETFDLHGGGADLIFPHHENEIAQSFSVFGKSPAQCWLHNGLVQIQNRKMSKSTGNALKLGHLLEHFPADALRLFLLSKQYRHPIDFSPAMMHAAVRNMLRLTRFFSAGPAPGSPAPPDLAQNAVWDQFCRAMDDDFNFPSALAVIFGAVRRLNRRMGAGPYAGGTGAADKTAPVISVLSYACREILGLCLTSQDEIPGL